MRQRAAHRGRARLAPRRRCGRHPRDLLILIAHPDLDTEQAYIDGAYEALERMKVSAARVGEAAMEGGVRGGTFAARVERDVLVQTSLQRLEQLELGHRSLVFGRMDRTNGETYYIGRVGVSAEDRTALVVDWRAPIASAFYRATAREPLEIRRRRHFLTEGRRLLHIEDEDLTGAETGLGGTGALVAALETARTGRMRDIVATVQAEQDEVIRAPLPGILVVQGGPGTGKTAVALHRAAYLLFTHRHQLERDRVLVVGPNQLFLRYIDQVLPALGESGVALSTPSGLVDEVRAEQADGPEVARVKGDVRMAAVIAKAVRDRQRPLRRDVHVRVMDVDLVLDVATSQSVIGAVRRSHRTHNDGRADVERLVAGRLYRHYVAAFRGRKEVDLSKDEFARELRRQPAMRRAYTWMWPRLSAAELVHDLLGSMPLLELASRRVLDRGERELLHRPWSDELRHVAWTHADVPLIDEAAVHLGPVRRRPDSTGEPTDYGHIVVDEAQDLTPMALRMLARRSRLGSMTLVGDVGQATGPSRVRTWDDVLTHLPVERGTRVAELTVNYRTPSEIMDLAGRVLGAAAPGLRPPSSVRSTGEQPVVVHTGDVAREAERLARAEHERVAPGTVAVIVPDAVELPFPYEDLDAPISVMPVADVKGLEFDAIVVVEPATILERFGPNALYVALTRATKRLTIVESLGLPGVLR